MASFEVSLGATQCLVSCLSQETLRGNTKKSDEILKEIGRKCKVVELGFEDHCLLFLVRNTTLS